MISSTLQRSEVQLLRQEERPRVAVFLDGASLEDMAAAAVAGSVSGFTTNPTLVAKAGVPNYREFAREAIARVQGAPISFEVLADDLPTMGEQARQIASWAPNVNVKVPIMTTQRESTLPLVRELTADGISINVTAVLTLEQVRGVAEVVDPAAPCFVSIFAGRIADTGRDPLPIMREAVELCRSKPLLRVLWASPREVLNVYQAAAIGVPVIVLTSELLSKLSLAGKDLFEYSRETVQMFYDDACKAGYTL